MSRRLRDALGGEGIPAIARGDVRIVSNDELTLTWPTTGSRTHRVIVVGSPSLLQSNALPMVNIVPCTSSPKLDDGLLEVAIPATEDAFTRPSYAITYLIQPVHRDDLGDRIGTVSDETLAVIDAGIFETLGIADYYGTPAQDEDGD